MSYLGRYTTKDGYVDIYGDLTMDKNKMLIVNTGDIYFPEFNAIKAKNIPWYVRICLLFVKSQCRWEDGRYFKEFRGKFYEA